MTAIPHSNRISIRDFLARRGIQPKYERSGYGMYLSPTGRAHAELQSGLRAKSLVRLRCAHIGYTINISMARD